MKRRNKILAEETLETTAQSLPNNYGKTGSSNTLVNHNGNTTNSFVSTSKAKKNRIIAEEVITKEILMLGLDKAGKTFFVQQMKDFINKNEEFGIENFFEYIKSVGVNFDEVNIPPKLKVLHSTPAKSFVIRDISALLMPNWDQYCGKTPKILFLVDSSDYFGFCGAISELFRVINKIITQKTTKIPVLVLWNKTDAPFCMETQIFKDLTNLDALEKELEQFHERIDFKFIESSSYKGDNFKSILEWMMS